MSEADGDRRLRPLRGGQDDGPRPRPGELSGIRFSVSHTTRAPRGAERDGVEYHFVDRGGVRSGCATRAASSSGPRSTGNLYGTGVAESSGRARRGRLLLDIDVQGAAQVRGASRTRSRSSSCPRRRGARAAPARTGPGRRGDDQAASGRGRPRDRRLRAVRLRVVNDGLDACVEELKSIVRAARCASQWRRAGSRDREHLQALQGDMREALARGSFRKSVDSKFQFITVAAQRAKQLRGGRSRGSRRTAASRHGSPWRRRSRRPISWEIRRGAGG